MDKKYFCTWLSYLQTVGVIEATDGTVDTIVLAKIDFNNNTFSWNNIESTNLENLFLYIAEYFNIPIGNITMHHPDWKWK